jgi:transcriptional regulator with XRE-family HTH domain
MKKAKKSLKICGHALAAMRRSRGLSQDELARRIGVSPRMVSHYECERRVPAADQLVAICRILSCEAEHLLIS